MKDTAIAYSIGAALQACTERVTAGQRPVRPAPDTTTRVRQAAPGVHLTQRQLEVLALLCEGLPNKLICRRLNIATGTVKVHISCILRELGVRSRLEAVVAARRYGLLGEPGPGVAARTEVDLPVHRPEAAGVRQAFGRYGDVVSF
jgi:DNA-binding NarL/FixJ family response regulator